MAKLLSTIIDGFLASKNFISGALGSGWKIWKMNGRYKFEVDDVVVRNTMTVFELLISKIRAVKGALGITQASGKIKSVREDTDNYYVQIEDEMTFVAHDIIKCQTFSSGQKNYWVIVDSIRVDTVGPETISEIVISKSEFSGSSLPEISDEIVQFGNTTDVRRQSAIYLHADENGVPAIDVLFNINTKTFDGCTKVRIGGDLPNEDGYKGFFCENGLIKSVNESGETMYMLRPDGSGFVAKEAIKWAVDGSGSIGDGAISWRYDKTTQKYVVEMGNNVILTWNNLDEQTKENLKGEGLIVEFSADGEEWHTIFEGGDLYQRQKVGNGAWNGPFKIVGQDANLLPWIEEWNSPDNQTEIGGEYVISPKMFSGTKNIDETLTGVAFGRSVVTVVENGVEKQKTGIFGLKNGKITFSIISDTGVAVMTDCVITGGEFMGFLLQNGKLRTKGNTKKYVEISSGNGNNPYIRYVDESNSSNVKSVGIGLYGSAFGITMENCDFFHDGGKYHTKQIQLGGVGMLDAIFSSEINRITASEGGVIPSNRYSVLISGANTQDMTIAPGRIDGQKLHITNITSNHRVTIKGLITGKNYWLDENTSNIFTWDGNNSKWCA